MHKARIGIYGLGTMGSALALNLAENGIRTAVTNYEPERIPVFLDEAGALAAQLDGQADLAGFVAALEVPRAVLFMIPSGAPLDAMLDRIAPLLDPGDTIVDGGNADFHDTIRREAALAERGLHFVGMGVSGGEAGARHGPSMMVGAAAESWQRMRDVLETIAAKYMDDPCVAHLGTGGAGHFVKTVHNGIEYADMQIISEIYTLLHDALGLRAAEAGQVFIRWDHGPLNSYLTEITGRLLQMSDPETGRPAINVILDSAGQKGTGRWTVIEAVRMGQSATIIEAAVAARAWSSEKKTRLRAEQRLGGARGAPDFTQTELEEAFLVARILAYAQGFRILDAASGEFGWDLDLARIAEIWRAGCIIRSTLLDDIARAFRTDAAGGRELILTDHFVPILQRGATVLRKVVAASVAEGYAVPALAAALGWFDTMRQGRGGTHLIQAQRDFFGAHGFARIDREGRHHGPWATPPGDGAAD